MRVTVLARAALALSLVSGCSFIAARAPQTNRARGEQPVCKSSSGSVAVDGLVAVTALALLVGNEDARLGAGLVGALYGGSAVYGFSATNRCDRARVAYQQELDLEAAEEAASRQRAAKAEEAARARKPSPSPSPLPAGGIVDPYRTLPPGTLAPTAPTAPTATATAPTATATTAAPTARPTTPTTPKPTPTAPKATAPTASAATDGADDSTEEGADDGAATDDDLEQRWRSFWRRLP